jgi:hypothetical protein
MIGKVVNLLKLDISDKKKGMIRIKITNKKYILQLIYNHKFMKKKNRK